MKLTETTAPNQFCTLVISNDLMQGTLFPLVRISRNSPGGKGHISPLIQFRAQEGAKSEN